MGLFKNSFIASLLVSLASAAAANACPHSHQQFICPDDPVVDSSGKTGNVIGVNPRRREAAVRYTNTYYSNSTHEIEALALGLGCIGSACVGDVVSDSRGFTGKIIGLNPYNFTAAIRFDNTYYSNTVVSLADTSLGLGCLEGYCVNDRAVDSSGRTGRIIAINYSRFQAVIKYDNSYYSNAVVAINSVALGLGCADGNCVGDGGSDSSGKTGKIIGVNHFNGHLAIGYDNSYYSNAVIDPSAFMSSAYCATYGDEHRAARRYIEVHGDRFRIILHTQDNAAGGFYFSIERQ